MEGFNAAMYGERIADVYDQHFSVEPDLTAKQLNVLSSLHQSGRVLEVGAGTGRIALPLALAGKDVHAIDISPKMLSVLKEKAAAQAATLEIELLDIAEEAPAGKYGLITCLFNTFYMLGGHDEQRRALENLTSCISEDGVLVIETWLMSERQKQDESFTQTLLIRRILPDEVVLSAILVDREDSRLDIGDIHFTKDGIRLFPHQAHYLTLEELDSRCKQAGFVLLDRWSDWNMTPFAAGLTDVISLYRLAPRTMQDDV
ncbi:class I SAM-dependent methyltransferase [Nonomuraea wenchangensis]|uniref:class I SAM-dependent methyltransferase n=1 Tax=Nonomuraea wenchangensis TaxID=568860 RepID=UPI0037B7B929